MNIFFPFTLCLDPSTLQDEILATNTTLESYIQWALSIRKGILQNYSKLLRFLINLDFYMELESLATTKIVCGISFERFFAKIFAFIYDLVGLLSTNISRH